MTEPEYTLAFDPGHTTGWAAFRHSDGATLNTGDVTFDNLMDFLAKYKDVNVTRVIIEEYVLYQKKALQQSGSRMITSQAIGMIKAWAQMKGGIEVIEQRSDIKAAAKKWSQIAYPKSHKDTHKADAWLHGYYYYKNAGVLKSALQLEVEAARGASK